MNAQTLVQKVWNFATVLRDDGVSCGGEVETAALRLGVSRSALYRRIEKLRE